MLFEDYKEVSPETQSFIDKTIENIGISKLLYYNILKAVDPQIEVLVAHKVSEVMNYYMKVDVVLLIDENVFNILENDIKTALIVDVISRWLNAELKSRY